MLRLRWDERQAKVGVRTQLLDRWLGERLITRCIQVDRQGLSLTQVQQIVDSLLPDVPVERVADDTPRARFRVTGDRSRRIRARTSARMGAGGLPRTPVR